MQAMTLIEIKKPILFCISLNGEKLFLDKWSDSSKKNKNEFQFLKWIKKIQKLSAVRKVLETLLFLALGSFGPKESF